MVNENSTTRRCTICGEPYPATAEYFYRNKAGLYGLQSRCKKCSNTLTRQWHADNPEASRELYRRKDASKRGRDPEGVKEANRIRSQRHMLKDRERKKLQSREGMQRWRASHREIHRLREHERRTRVRELPFDFDESQWQRTLEYFNHACAYCGRSADLWTVLAIDHYIPLTSGDCTGTIPTNLVPACHAKKGSPDGQTGCNQSKNNRDPIEWAITRFGNRKSKVIISKIATYFDWVVNQ